MIKTFAKKLQSTTRLETSDWARIDSSLLAQCFTGQAKSSESWCKSCHSLDHLSDACHLHQSVLRLPTSSQCSVAMATAIQVCTELGIPIEPEKNEGPATTLSVLGIEFDTEAMMLRLPNTKLRPSLFSEWNATLKHGMDREIRRMRKTSHCYLNVSLVM